MKKIITILSLVMLLITTAFTQAGPQSTWAGVTSSGVSGVEVIEVKEASNGNVYVLVQSNNGSADIIQLIKYNSSGVEQFSQTYSGSSYERPIGMGLDNSENIYIVSNSGTNYARVLKYNSSGSLQWSSNYGGAITYIEPKSMLVNETTGDVYFTGAFENQTNSEGKNVFLAKFNNAGSFQWQSFYNSSTDGIDIGYSLTKDNSNNFYIGAMEKTGFPIVLKYNSSGTQQWKISSVGENAIHLVGTDKVGVYGLNDYGEYFISNGATSNTVDFSVSPLFSGVAVYNKTTDGGFIRVGSSGKLDKFNSVGASVWGSFQNNYNEAISYVDPYDDLIVLTKSGTPWYMGAKKYDGATGGSGSGWLYKYVDRAINTTYNTDNRIAFTESANNTMVIARAFYYSSTDMRIHVNKFCLPPKVTSTSTIPASPGSLCPGDIIQVQASSTFGNSYSWSAINGNFPVSTGSLVDFVAYNNLATNASAAITVAADYNGCYSEQTMSSITIHPSVPADIDFSNVPNCAGEGTLSAITKKGWYSYEWFIDGVGQGASSNDSIVVNQSGNYELVVTSSNPGNCVSDNPGFITVSVDPAPSVIANVSVSTICNGNAVTFTGSGATNYVWDNGVSDGVTFTPGSTATYTVIGTDGNGCTNTDVVTVTVNSAPTINLGSNISVCQGMTTTIDAGSGSSSYSWNTGATTQTITTGAGTYDVTITDGNGCQANDDIIISEYNAVTGNASAIDATCGNNNGSASVSVTSGTSPYSYSWSNGGSTQSISNLSAGSYTVTITDGNGCEGQATASVSSAGGASLTASSTDVLCNGNATGTASVSTSGGSSPFSYLWNTGGTSSSVSNLTAGTYSVDVTDNNGCISSTSITITESSSFSIIPGSTDVSCNGGNDGVVNVSVTGATSPYSYSWTSGGSTASETNLQAGSYTVTITDTYSCTANQTITVNEPAAIVLTTSATDATCGNSDGSATTAATGGAGSYSYSWNDGASQITQTATNLVSGTYVVTVTDIDGCSNTASVNVNDAGAPALTTSIADVNCVGGNDGSATVSATGGVSPLDYSWDNGETSQTTSGLLEGSYTVTVTDNNGCSSSVTITVEATNQLPLVDLGPDSLMCSNENMALDAGTGFVSYLWDDNSTNQTLTVSASGTYSVEVTDNNGCSNTDAVVITTEICSSIEESVTSTINVFPNPGRDYINITGDNLTGKLFTLYSFEGKRVYQQILLENTFNMDISKYEAGTYFVSVEGVQPVRIIIIK